MYRFFLIVLISIFSVKAFSQDNSILLIDGAIGLSQSELKYFLRGVLKGREPERAPHTDRIAYTLDNAYVHVDYYITDDSCLSGGILFKNPLEYKKAKESITSICPQLEGMKETYYKISPNKRIVYYIFSEEDLTVVAMDKSLLLRK